MKGKNGNLIMTIREGESIEVDGPARFILKTIKKNKVVVLVNADNETNIKKRVSKEMAEYKEIAKD
jgi:sRNA-binding carbon storage regulator CsrA